jgi:hypothetical protein
MDKVSGVHGDPPNSGFRIRSLLTEKKPAEELQGFCWLNRTYVIENGDHGPPR